MNKLERFTDYITKYATAREISIDEAWGHAAIRVFWEWLNEQ